MGLAKPIGLVLVSSISLGMVLAYPGSLIETAASLATVAYAGWYLIGEFLK